MIHSYTTEWINAVATPAMRWASDRLEWASSSASAFLALPTDRDVLEGAPDNPVQGFGPMLVKPMPFKSVVVASRNDSLVSFDRATAFADAWNATLFDAGMSGHRGSEENLNVWPQGLVVWGQFLDSLE